MRKPPPTTPSDLPPCRLCSGICPYKVPAIGPDGKPAIMCTEERRRTASTLSVGRLSSGEK